MPDKTIYRVSIDTTTHVIRFWTVWGSRDYPIYAGDQCRLDRLDWRGFYRREIGRKIEFQKIEITPD